MRPSLLAKWFVACALLVTLPSLTSWPGADEARPDQTALEVRAELSKVYSEWGRARIALDAETLERFLAPDFQLLMEGKQHGRAEFVRMITQRWKGVRLKRFDVDILTTEPGADRWSLVITEKLEYEISRDEAPVETAYDFWVTRDIWRRTESGWRAVSSEAIGHEGWDGGAKPPIGAW